MGTFFSMSLQTLTRSFLRRGTLALAFAAFLEPYSQGGEQED